jgi:thiamine pyrophosphokinase
MIRGILMIGGAGPQSSTIQRTVQNGDIICCADSGLDAAIAAGIRPHRIVGDMDSISDKALLEGFPREIVDIHPGDKDETDTEIGLDWLKKQGCSHITLIGGGEGRLDHTLAIISLFGMPNPPNLWLTAREKIEYIEGQVAITDKPSAGVSFCTAGEGPWKAASRGLHWELDEVVWNTGSVSLSNRLNGTTAEIDIQQGRLLMIRELLEIEGRQQ